VKFPGWTSLALIICLVAIGSTVAYPPLPAVAGEKGIIFGRLNDKVMGNSWSGEGKLVVIVGDNEKNDKKFKMCPNGYVAAEVDAGKVKLDVVENKKEKNKEKREAFLNQPVLSVAAGRATYFGNVKIGYDYGSLTFRSEDKLANALAALQACLVTDLGKEKLADKLAAINNQVPPAVDKQFVFVDMNLR